jgi:hypothetical protein
MAREQQGGMKRRATVALVATCIGVGLSEEAPWIVETIGHEIGAKLLGPCAPLAP